MFGFEFFEELLDWAGPALSNIFKTLPNTFPRIGLSSDIQEALVRLGVLNHCRSLPVDGQHYWALTFLDLFEKLTRTPPESSKRLDIIWNIEHGSV
jgi:hypothetical protein